MKEKDKVLTLDHFREVMLACVEQITNGKGNQRHGSDVPFEDQPWRLISDNVGEGFVIGQAIKKLMELKAHNQAMITNEGSPGKYFESYGKWKADALGAIVYTVMAIMYKEYTVMGTEET